MIGIWYFVITGRLMCERLAAALYDNCSVWLDRKMKMYQELALTPEPKRTTIEVNGEKKLIRQLASDTGLATPTVLARLGRGWSVRDALFQPLCVPGARLVREGA